MILQHSELKTVLIIIFLFCQNTYLLHVCGFSLQSAEPLVEILKLPVDGGEVASKDLLHLLVDLKLSSLKIETGCQIEVNFKFLLAQYSVSPITYWFTCLSVHLVSNLL